MHIFGDLFAAIIRWVKI